MRNIFRWLLNQPPYDPAEDPEDSHERMELEARKHRTQELIERTDRLVDNESRITIYRNLLEHREGRPRRAN